MKQYLDLYAIEEEFMYTNPYSFLQIKPIKGKRIKVRTEPKIQRNDICPKCDSGLKYKKCCMLKTN